MFFLLYHCFFGIFSIASKSLTSNGITRRRITVTWASQPKIDSYEVAASNSKSAAQFNCSVAHSDTQASCEGLSPCTEYNISIRACSDNRGCGEPAILTVTTLPGRKLRGPSLKVNVKALHISLTRTDIPLLCLNSGRKTHKRRPCSGRVEGRVFKSNLK